jgi:hypothetical protein
VDPLNALLRDRDLDGDFPGSDSYFAFSPAAPLGSSDWNTTRETSPCLHFSARLADLF